MSSPEFADLRQSQDRDYASMGIAMVLALVSETEPIPEPDELTRQAGEELGQTISRFREAAAGSLRDGDLGMTIGVLQAAAFRDFDAAAPS